MRNIVNNYLQSGLSCLPVKLDKSPDVNGTWKGGISDLSMYDNAKGVGLICGKLSGNLECLDFDNHFGDAKKTLSEFIKAIKQLYDHYKFPIQSTQSGGYHLLYRCEVIEGNRKIASKPKLKNNKWIPDAIIETRGEGGYFVIDPTPKYKIIRNDIFNIPRITPEERKEIIDICKSFNEWSEPIKVPSYEDKEKPGDYYNSQQEAKQDMIECLRIAGWKQTGTFTWQRPDKAKGISATLGKVADNVFYNFSSNSHPFEPEKGYTPFQVVALLKFNGNFGECAKWIIEKYHLRTVNDYHKPKAELKEVKKTPSDLDNILTDCFVDIDVIVDKPPVIMSINHSINQYANWDRLMTLGNFSIITGKSKAKKTFLLKKIIATLGTNAADRDNKFCASLPENKTAILHFDTEQSNYDVWKAAADIHTIAGNMPNVGTFKLRDRKPIERLEIIKHAIDKFRDSIGVVIIDGIADLVNSINSEDEANEILHKFMKWTVDYNIHIIGVLHQNKGNDFATGWIGTQILKKAELVIGVEKAKEDPKYSRVYCDVIRGAKEFPDFNFFINQDGHPEISSTFISQTF